MFCGRCGNKLDDDDLFCRECGEPVPMQARAQQAAREQNRTAAQVTSVSESATAAAGSDRTVAVNDTAAAAKNTVKDSVPAGNTADRTDWAGLVERFKNGTGAQKSDAFTALYDASYKKVYAHVQKYARNEEKSSDAVQNAYIKCWNNIGQLEDGARFLPWMKQIAYNEFLLMLRKDNRITDFGAVTDDEGNETPAEDFLADDTLPMPEDAYANEELHRLLLESIDALSEGQRVVLKGFYFDSKPVQTLAEELGVPVNTVKTHLSRGRKNLAVRVSAYANAYGLKLVPLAVLPLMAELGKKDAYACEVSAAVAGAAQVIAAAQKAVVAAGATSTAAVGSAAQTAAGASATTKTAAAAGTAAKTAAETAATGAGSTAVGGSSAAAASAGAAGAGQAAGTAAAAGSSFAVKAGIGLTVVAVAAGGGGAYAYHQATTPEVIEEPAVVEEPEEEIERIPDELRMSAMYESIQETYGIVSDSSMTSPCWLVQEGTTLDIAFTSSGADGKEYPLFVPGEEDSYEGILRTGTYDGESGAYAIYEKDLDRDGDQELIAFIRTQDYAEGDPYPARNDWHFDLVVYDVEDGILLSTDPQEINTIQFGDDVSDAADMRGLIVYYKEAADADEILCYRYQTLTYCFDGYWYYYNLTGYTYRDGQLQMVASVGRDYLEGAYSNGQYNPVGANTSQEEQIAGLRALGLDRSADVTADGTFDAFDERYALQEDGVLDEDNNFYLRQEMISRDEPDIEYLFEYYPVDHVEMEDWTNVDFDYVIQQYDISTWSFEQKLRIYNTEDLVDEAPVPSEAPDESESTQTNETEENP